MSVTSERVQKLARGAARKLAEAPLPTVFEPGRNCYRVGHADRVALIVDGEAYFKAFVNAALRATRSIVIVGWDFHSRTQLHHGIDGLPAMLGDFLNFLAKRRRRLDIRILTWDYPVLFAKGRELSPIYGLGWRPHRRVRLRYDDHYPVGASQHQKIVLVDGALAFCGGLDLTRSRWDTKEHTPGDHRRINEGDEDHYAPFHDTVMAMDGEAARVLDEIVRERWFRATGHPLKRTIVEGADPWPPALPVSLTDANVALARTRAALNDDPQIREVQALYLDMIARAKRTIYIENQYFTSHSLGEALAARLAEKDGPEIIAVLRLSTQGWLEAPTMGTLRTVLLKKLRDADKHGRFHAYFPDIPGLPEGQCCDLHSKLMIVDDEVVRIGSANFSNRSMGLDTECDAAIEARGDERIAAVIRGFRNELLGEHLGTSAETVEAAVREAGGSVRGAIEALMNDERSLRKYERLDDVSDTLVTVANIADPEQPVSLDSLIAQLPPEEREAARRPRWVLPVAVLAIACALTAMWRYTPLAAWTDADRAVAWAADFSNLWWAPLLVIAAYTPACLVLFPRAFITLLAVASFGSWHGFAYAMGGILLACTITYYVGTKMNRQTVRRLARGKLTRMSQIMRHRGIIAMTAVRLVPLAPFAVVNVVAGAIHLRFRDFMIGSALGILPGTLVATVFGEQVVSGLKDPGSINLWLLGALVVALVVGTRYVRRWLFGRASAPTTTHGRRLGYPA
ncbi:MAG: VTT domain-containing protein [Gammaproteobacteria bacterium]